MAFIGHCCLQIDFSDMCLSLTVRFRTVGPSNPLNELPRIHRRQNPDAWHHYARECGIHLDNPAQGVRYDLHEMAIAAVIAGQGVALVPRMYVENELRCGMLVSPWPASGCLSKNSV